MDNTTRIQQWEQPIAELFADVHSKLNTAKTLFQRGAFDDARHVVISCTNTLNGVYSMLNIASKKLGSSRGTNVSRRGNKRSYRNTADGGGNGELPTSLENISNENLGRIVRRTVAELPRREHSIAA